MSSEEHEAVDLNDFHQESVLPFNSENMKNKNECNLNIMSRKFNSK